MHRAAKKLTAKKKEKKKAGINTRGSMPTPTAGAMMTKEQEFAEEDPDDDEKFYENIKNQGDTFYEQEKKIFERDWKTYTFRGTFILSNLGFLVALYFLFESFRTLLLEDEILNADPEMFKDDIANAYNVMLAVFAVQCSCVAMALLFSFFIQCQQRKGLIAFYGVILFSFGFLGLTTLGFDLLSQQSSKSFDDNLHLMCENKTNELYTNHFPNFIAKMTIKGGKQVDYMSRFANKMACTESCPCFSEFLKTDGTFIQITDEGGNLNTTADFNRIDDLILRERGRTKTKYYFAGYDEPDLTTTAGKHAYRGYQTKTKNTANSKSKTCARWGNLDVGATIVHKEYRQRQVQQKKEGNDLAQNFCRYPDLPEDKRYGKSTIFCFAYDANELVVEECEPIKKGAAENDKPTDDEGIEQIVVTMNKAQAFGGTFSLQQCLKRLRVEKDFKKIYRTFGSTTEGAGLKDGNFTKSEIFAPNPMGIYFMQEGSFKLMEKLESKFKCAGMCGYDPPLFYTTKGLNFGVPKVTCYEQFHAYVGQSVEIPGQMSIFCGLFSLYIFILHFGLYVKTDRVKRQEKKQHRIDEQLKKAEKSKFKKKLLEDNRKSQAYQYRHKSNHKKRGKGEGAELVQLCDGQDDMESNLKIINNNNLNIR